MEDKKEESINTEETLNETETLRAEIENLKVKLEEEDKRYLRLTADFQNFQKRQEEVLKQRIAFSTEKILKNILPIFEDLERALVADTTDYEKLKEGVSLTYNKILNLLKEEEIEIIDPLNEAYNPEYHEAIASTNDEEKDNDVVVNVYSKGYKLKNKLLQTAKVQINKK